MKYSKQHPLADHILMYLKDTSKELLIVGATMLFDPWKLTKGLSLYRDPTTSYYVRKKIYNLKNSPYFIVKGNQYFVSPKGRIKIIKHIIKEKKKLKRWDGKWRAVIFDVPENNRQQRNFLRKELKWMGFKELQHSVWITPYDIEKELLCLLKLWHADFTGDIRFLKIEKITNDGNFKKAFGL